MPLPRLVGRAQDLDFELASLPALPPPQRILMADPEFFDVEYVINVHMEGQVGNVDRFAARRQWRELRRAYEGLGIPVDVIPGEPFLPDLVFTANQSFPCPPGMLAEGASAVMSVMRSARRQPEVRVVARQHESRGLHLEWLDAFEVPSFEAMGDSLWHPGRALLHAGVGPRSAPEAFRHVAAWTGVPVLLYEMKDPRFYHLDTCLSLLDERTAAAYLPAFTDDGKALLRQVFERVVEVDDREAAEQMFCNGHCPDGRHFLVQAGCPNGCAALRELGFEPLELETSEYLKSGGSVFCLKLHYWA